MELLIETVQVPNHSSFAGLSVAETHLRKRSGASILGIGREAQTWVNPDPRERILGGDFLVLSGTKEQLKRAIAILGEERDVDLERDRKPSSVMVPDIGMNAADPEPEEVPEPSSRMSNE